HPAAGAQTAARPRRTPRTGTVRAMVVNNRSTAWGNFDEHQPPAPELIDDCVHCGFCLPTCPTYVLWGEEMDSPRGRIYLMDLVGHGAADFDQTLVRHFDTCVGCMAC